MHTTYDVGRISPSVVFYLLAVCPAIWLLRLGRIDSFNDALNGISDGNTSATVTNATVTNNGTCPPMEEEVRLSAVQGVSSCSF